ncbi:MAG: hypothetical protein N2V74_03685 [Candidatus Methanospirare jalkutatii]|nr:MAG: hypothetical protein N2V74_02175 [Candidatus Methanospirare jalkutatii]UYZ40806.1 MAG: hypothetical protein N2V74_03685 [Candidatus Methanospirare jalkutatii]
MRTLRQHFEQVVEQVVGKWSAEHLGVCRHVRRDGVRRRCFLV